MKGKFNIFFFRKKKCNEYLPFEIHVMPKSCPAIGEIKVSFFYFLLFFFFKKKKLTILTSANLIERSFA
jgi:hypothetical protein